MSMAAHPSLSQIVHFFEQLKAEDVARLGEFYSVTSYFKDPFNEVDSLVDMQPIFAHMFEQLDAPRFVVRSAFGEGEQALLIWDFHFRRKGETQERRIHGSSHLRFDAQGLVCYHRDYWDTAEELYEHLPLLGAVLRFLKRKLSATPTRT